MQILFITSGSIGDVIISTGLLGHLADTYPEARFTIAAGPAAAPLFEAFPRLQRLIVLRKQPWNRHWLDFWHEVRGQKWDMVVDLRGGIAAFLLRAPQRKVFRHPDPRKSKAEQLAALFDLPEPPPTRLWASEASRQNARVLVPGKPFIVLAPKSNSAAKDWPIERFAELAQRLCNENYVAVVLAAPHQQASIQPLIQALPPSQIFDLSGRTDLLTAYAIMEQAQLFIGNDSGLLHMAAAAKTRCIGIYGPSNHKIYAPSGPHVSIIAIHEFGWGEQEKRNVRYMEMISVDKVEMVTRELISKPLP